MVVRTQDTAHAKPASKLVSAEDVVTTLTFLVLGIAVALLPESLVRALCGGLARIHIALRGSKARELGDVPELAASGTDLRALEREIQSRSYEELAQPLLERRRAGWQPRIDLEGREHLDRALSDGRGAVLWVVPSFDGETVLRKAMHANGFPLVDLRVPNHPYSGTRFGRRYLNPIRLEVEDRYMAERVVLHDFADTRALQELQKQLKQNRVVDIMASGNSEKPAEIALFGGRLSLALGAPALAMLSNAPLMPAFVAPTASGGYVVRIGAPMTVEGKRGGRAAWFDLANAFAQRLKDHVLAYPGQWQGWYDRDNWTPHAVPGASQAAPAGVHEPAAP